MSEMTEQRLIKWLEAGYPYLKVGSGLPAWVLPECSLNRTADEVGDSGILRMGGPLKVTDAVEHLWDSASDPSTLSEEAWQKAVANWPHLSQVRPIVEAFLDVAGGIMGQFQRLRSRIDPMVICRSLAVLLFAPFVSSGKSLLAELAEVLGGNASQPDQLIASYADAVLREDIVALEGVNRCVVRYPRWSQWATVVEKQVLSCQQTPRLIMVTPPFSADLASILASMMKEGQDELGRNHREYPGSQVPA